MLTKPSEIVHLPYKSVAAALIFSVFFGPVGLLYGSLMGGLIMISAGIVVMSCKFFFLVILMWLISCIWSVAAVESHNKKIWHVYCAHALK